MCNKVLSMTLTFIIMISNITPKSYAMEEVYSKVSTVIATPTSGDYLINTPVTLETEAVGAEIRYTTDGSNPTELSSLYVKEIKLLNDMTIKAIAYKDGCDSSEIATYYYTVVTDEVIKKYKRHWSESVINEMVSKIIIDQCKNISPNAGITRAEFISYMSRGLDLSRESAENVELESEFTDVSIDDEHYIAISIANECGVVNGYTDGTFKPDQIISREEAMVIFANIMKFINLNQDSSLDKLSSYSDVNEVSSWAISDVNVIVNANILNGRTKDMLIPKGELTHSEAITAMKNLLEKSKLLD